MNITDKRFVFIKDEEQLQIVKDEEDEWKSHYARVKANKGSLSDDE